MIPVVKAPNPAEEHSRPLTIIQPSRRWFSLGLRELWQYRDLLYFLAWRDVKVRYKQTLLGVAWAVVQPLLTMVLFSVVFGRLAGISSDGLPYPLFAFAALLPWQLFSYALTNSANSLVANERLISKVYFPRLIIPISSTLAGLVDFVVSFFILLILMAYFGIMPTIAIITLPFFILLALLSAFAVGLWLSALNVLYRDVRYTLNFLTQIWLFATPIAYPSSMIPEQWRVLYALNPMAGVVEGFRWALLGTTGNVGGLVAISTVAVLVLLVGGLVYFRRMERTFADTI